MAKNKSTERLVNAPQGRGCGHCEIGIPIDYTVHARAVVRLCLECVLIWFMGWTVTEWEAHHAPLTDHLGDRIEAAIEKEMRDGLRELLKAAS